MAIALAPAPPRQRRERRSHYRPRDFLVVGRGLRRALTAAIRAGRSPQQIASEAAVHTREIERLLDGAAFATPTLSEKLERVLDVTEKTVVLDARSGHVPYAIFADLIEQSIEKHGIESTATLIQTSPRRLNAFRSGDSRVLHINAADALVIGLADASLWLRDRELRRWYFAEVARV